MSGPRPGDVILRGSQVDGFELIDASTERKLAQGLPSVQEALSVARQHNALEIWQQNVDNRGRPLGEPFRLSHQFASS